jgi:hypothetical protein
MVQEIVPVPPGAGFVQAKAGPEVWVLLTNVVPAGVASDIVTVAASLGPLFVTVTMNATFDTSGAAVVVFVTARSADPVSVVEAVELLFAELKSAVALLIVAVLMMVVPVPPELVPRTSVNVAVAGLANVGALQVIVPLPPTAGVAQLNPAGVLMETNVVFAGMTSETTTETAGFGPLFVAVIV